MTASASISFLTSGPSNSSSTALDVTLSHRGGNNACPNYTHLRSPPPPTTTTTETNRTRIGAAMKTTATKAGAANAAARDDEKPLESPMAKQSGVRQRTIVQGSNRDCNHVNKDDNRRMFPLALRMPVRQPTLVLREDDNGDNKNQTPPTLPQRRNSRATGAGVMDAAGLHDEAAVWSLPDWGMGPNKGSGETGPHAQARFRSAPAVMQRHEDSVSTLTCLSALDDLTIMDDDDNNYHDGHNDNVFHPRPGEGPPAMPVRLPTLEHLEVEVETSDDSLMDPEGRHGHGEGGRPVLMRHPSPVVPVQAPTMPRRRSTLTTQASKKIPATIREEENDSNTTEEGGAASWAESTRYERRRHRRTTNNVKDDHNSSNNCVVSISSTRAAAAPVASPAPHPHGVSPRSRQQHCPDDQHHPRRLKTAIVSPNPRPPSQQQQPPSPPPPTPPLQYHNSGGDANAARPPVQPRRRPSDVITVAAEATIPMTAVITTPSSSSSPFFPG